MTKLYLGGAVYLAVLAAGLAPVGGQQPPDRRPALAASIAGGESFELYCATCHGTQGTGDGPVASALRTRPPDLTALARRNGGAFPGDRVLGLLGGAPDGAPYPLLAHGTSDMPVWGPIFRAFESDALARQRLRNLVDHLESIQAPATNPGDLGSRLFRLHCSSCHGPHALGNGPMAGLLRHQPPDLTQYTERNGGVFPSERVRQIIDGRHVPSHGDRDMPIWGDAFRRTRDGIDVESAEARIDAILRYLAGIQQRRG